MYEKPAVVSAAEVTFLKKLRRFILISFITKTPSYSEFPTWEIQYEFKEDIFTFVRVLYDAYHILT